MNTESRSTRPGSMVRTPYLLAQARYFVTLVKGDSSVLKRLGTRFMSEFESAVARLEAQQAAVFKARFESRERWLAVAGLAQSAVAWIRGFRRMYAHARRHVDGLPTLPGGAPRVTVNHPKLALLAEDLADHGLKHVDVLSAYGLDATFLAEGRKLAEATLAADEKQENARRGALPESYKTLREVKSIVHEAVKRVVVIARSVHEGDRVKSREYSLRILYHGLPGAAHAPPPESKPEVA